MQNMRLFYYQEYVPQLLSIDLWVFLLQKGNAERVKWGRQVGKGALAWYGKLTWESAHAWILKILCYLVVWGITLIFMVRLSFLCNSIANL